MTTLEPAIPPEAARRLVSSQLERPVSRTSFYEWRKQLQWVGPKYRYYSPLAVNALVVFGQHVNAGWRMDDAAEQTINYLRMQADD